MREDYWWNNTDMGQPKYLKINMSQFQNSKFYFLFCSKYTEFLMTKRSMIISVPVPVAGILLIHEQGEFPGNWLLTSEAASSFPLWYKFKIPVTVTKKKVLKYSSTFTDPCVCSAQRTLPSSIFAYDISGFCYYSTVLWVYINSLLPYFTPLLNFY